MASNSDLALPKALTDFVYDLFDSVTLSQIAEEQSKFYDTDFPELSKKYFSNQPWPTPQSIASECNGDPLFLALYREMTHRHWHQVSRPSLRDRIDGWQVYRELFEEMLESTSFYVLPSWIFDILNEFVYQFQGFCQVRSALYNTARKQGLVGADGSLQPTQGNHPSNLIENLTVLKNSTDAWDIEAVFGYLNRLSRIGFPKEGSSAKISPAATYLSIFSAVSRSRLECLVGDYVGSLQALTPLSAHADYAIPKGDASTVTTALNSVFAARLSVAYHAGVSLLMLRRYKDATKTIGDICAMMQRNYKTGQSRKIPGLDQSNKQYDRMLSLLAILHHICPTQGIVNDSVARAVHEKHGSRLQSASSFEDWFQSPKFVSADPNVNLYRQQVELFLEEMKPATANLDMRSYLKLYSALPVEKLAKFHDKSVDDFLPRLWSYKVRTRQMERSATDSFTEGSWKVALDIHYYINGSTVNIGEAEKQRRFENYFVAQIAQASEVCKEAVAINTKV
jgi:translation initiation factor 3 subunit L